MSSSFDMFSTDDVEEDNLAIRDGPPPSTTTPPPPPHPFNDDYEDNNYGYENYPFGDQPVAGFPGDDVTVDHINTNNNNNDSLHSPEPYGFGLSPNPPLFSPSLFNSPLPESNGNWDVGDDDGFFSLGGAILPPPTEMLPEEGVALREWRR